MPRRLIMTIEVIVPDFMKECSPGAMNDFMVRGLYMLCGDVARDLGIIHVCGTGTSTTLLASVERTDNAPVTQTEKELRT